MVKGMRAYNWKEKRKMRIRNHIAKDLAKPKYHQRRKEGKKEDDQYEHWTKQEWLKHLDEDNDIEE